jgi:hypothetical protein
MLCDRGSIQFGSRVDGIRMNAWLENSSEINLDCDRFLDHLNQTLGHFKQILDDLNEILDDLLAWDWGYGTGAKPRLRQMRAP